MRTAVYDRELSANEVYQHYTRGVTRQLFQVRTCASVCSNESFVGPSGAGSYYSIQSSQAVTPGVTLNVTQNRYFQYQNDVRKRRSGCIARSDLGNGWAGAWRGGCYSGNLQPG